jgi:archaellum component FlaF (FlaF/FlaG flagellin family)
MTACIGTFLLFAIIVGGGYFYSRVSQFNREIEEKNNEAEDDASRNLNHDR